MDKAKSPSVGIVISGGCYFFSGKHHSRCYIWPDRWGVL